MSRIFDALQRSGTEQSGVEYPDMVSVATAVFEPARQSTPPLLNDQMERMQPPVVPDVVLETMIPEIPSQVEATAAPISFPSMEVSVTPESRLVFLTQPESLA